MPSDEEEGSSLTGLLAVIFAQASGANNAAPPPPPSLSGPSTSTSAAAVDPTASLLSLIRRAQARVQALSLISPNDSLDDLPTSALRVVLLNSVYAQVCSRSHTRPGDFEARKSILQQSSDGYRAFLKQTIALDILDGTSSTPYVAILTAQVQKALGAANSSPFSENAAERRSSKIAAMKLERALTHALDEFRTALRAKHAVGNAVRSTANASAGSSLSSSVTPPDTSFDLLILPRRDNEGDDDDDEEEEETRESGGGAFVGGSDTGGEMGVKTPSSLRSYLIMLCQLHALQALGALDSVHTELQLLNAMPPEAEREAQARAAQERAEIERRRRQGGGGGEAADDWRLDQRWGATNDSPILDPRGKPLRPFTILPGQGNTGRGAGSLGTAQGQMDARRRLQAQVFQPSHRLPTMTIDEYLAEEERRGNIIQGGGQASADRPTNKEMLAMRAEGGDGAGTREADEAEEEQRRKAIEWDEFTEANPRGAGNTMNRG